MVNNQFLSTSELDYSTYRTNLKTFLKGQDRFNDYNFEGSDIGVLIDLLAYNTFLNGFYLNMDASESFLDSAQLRESAVSRAKELNYLPRSRSTSRAIVQITVSPGDSPSTVVIPKYYKLSSTIDSKNFIFTTDEAIVVTNNSGVYRTANVNIFEGRVVTEQFIANNSINQYTISSANVDSSSVSVSIQNSNTDISNSIWQYAASLYALDGQSNAYFLQGYGADQYQIIFGNGVTGRQLSAGNIVTITYRDCSSSDSDDCVTFRPVENIQTYSAISVLTVQSSFGGAEKETLESIKFNAPRHYSTQRRAVTKLDYLILVKQQFPELQAVTGYGGEELTIKQYGRSIISTKPFGGLITPTTTKNRILTFLQDKMPVGVRAVIIDADYFNIEIISDVKYNSVLTLKTPADIKTLTTTTIQQFANTNLYTFDSDFRYSKFITSIDLVDPSIISNDTAVRLIKRIVPIPAVNNSFTIEFGNSLIVGQQSAPSIQSSSFVYTHTDNIQYNAFIQDNANGVLQIVTYGAGQSIVVLASNIGSINYITGTASLTNVNVTSFVNYISLYARILSKDIYINQNQILVVDLLDVVVTVTAVSSHVTN